MKKILWIIIPIFLFTACSSTPEKDVNIVAQKYLNAVGNYKFDEARKYITVSSQPLIDKMEDFVDMAPEKEIQKNLPVNVKIQQVSVNQDTAFVRFETVSPLYTHNGKIYLVKNKDIWKVDLLKSFPPQKDN